MDDFAARLRAIKARPYPYGGSNGTAQANFESDQKRSIEQVANDAILEIASLRGQLATKAPTPAAAMVSGDSLLRDSVVPAAKTEVAWIDRLASLYGARQMAALRGDQAAWNDRDHWLSLTAKDHWHEILAALQAAPERGEG